MPAKALPYKPRERCMMCREEKSFTRRVNGWVVCTSKTCINTAKEREPREDVRYGRSR